MRSSPVIDLLTRVWLTAIFALAVWGTANSQTTIPALEGVADLRRVARLAGQNSINQTDSLWNVAGTDLGHVFSMGNRLYMVFGDTFGQGFVAPPGAGPAPDWRSNVMAVIADTDPSDGLAFERMISDPQGRAKELIAPYRDSDEVTVIPTNGIAVGNRMYLHYMAVREWGSPGQWTLARAGIAYSDDGGQNWARLPWSWPYYTRFGQVAFVRDGGYIYLMGIPGGRSGGVCVARVAETDIATPTAYRYYVGRSDGAAVWSSDANAAVRVVPAPVGELSVMWNAYLGRWIMTSLRGADIVIREAPDLLGPWSDPITLVAARDYPGLYAPYMHPWLVERDGEIVYFTMSEWGTYSVSLMQARLVKKPEPLTRDDVARALAIAGGQASATGADVERLGAGAARIDIPVCVRLLREALAPP